MSKRRGLGRGLGALIPTDQNTADTDSITGLKMIAPTAVAPNPHQPRTEFDPEKLQELADSIAEHGLIQPLIVTQSGPETYTLIAGERRWRAAQLAKIKQVPVVIKEATEQQMLEMAIIENVQRADLNPLEEAHAYRQLIDAFDMTQKQVAERMGKGRSTVANLLRLLDLPPIVQQAVINNKISGRHGREMLRLENEDDQRSVLESVIELDLNVRQTVTLIDKMVAKRKPQPKPTQTISPEVRAVQDSFRQALGTRVDVQKSGRGGKVVIHFYSDEELNGIYDTIVREEER